MKSTGHRVFIYSYSEDNTVTVIISGKFNCLIFERRVFGIPADELEECDFPEENELLGAQLKTREEIDKFIADRLTS